MKQKGGFTLFELLIAMFIGTILIMSGAYAIKTGLFSLEREDVWFNDATKERAAFDFFWQQVSSLHSLQTSNENDNEDAPLQKKGKTTQEEPAYFVGEKDLLVFMSPLSLKKHYGQGMILANYKIVYNTSGKYDLIYHEMPVNSTIINNWSEELENKLIIAKDITFFFRDCDFISFAYFSQEKTDDKVNTLTAMKNTESTEGKESSWKEKISGMTPQAVKLTVTKHGKEQELLSPIMVTYLSSASGQL